MNDMGNGVDDGGRTSLEDSDIEALLAGRGTDRQDLASLDRFLDEVRAPRPGFVPRPAGELARLFAEGPRGVFGAAPVAAGDRALLSAVPGRAASTGRKSIRLAKLAVVTTTATLAVTLAAAAQVLPGFQSRTPDSVSGPATPVQVGAPQGVTVRTPDFATVPGVTVQQPRTSPPLRPGGTVRSAEEGDLEAMSADALARLPLDVLRTLSPEKLSRLPVEVLRTLPGEVLARLPPEVQKTLPSDVLVKLPVDALKILPAEALARLPVDVLRTLPPETLSRLPADVIRTLPGDLLARLPLDLLRGLPADVRRRLPVDILRLVRLRPAPNMTTSTTAPVRL